MTASSAVLAAKPADGSLVALVRLAAGFVLLGAASLTLLFAVRPRLLKTGQTVTGWPALLAPDQPRR